MTVAAFWIGWLVIWPTVCALIAQSRGMAGGRRLFNVPLYVYPQLLRAVGRMVWSHLTLPADEAFNREIVVFHFLGLMQGLYRSR